MLLFALLIFMISSCQKTPSTPSGEASFTNTKSYQAKRNTWRSQDQKQHFAAGIQLSATEKQLDTLLQKMVSTMMKEYRDQAYYPAANSFFKVKDHMEQSALFYLLKDMPKGGLLHVHDLALPSAHYIVDEAIQQPDCYVYWEEEGDHLVKGQLHFFQAEQVPEGYVSVGKMAASDPNFRSELYDLLTFDEGLLKDTVDIWKHFEPQFARRLGFFNYQPIFKKHVVAAFDSLIADGIQHVELRSIISDGMYDLTHEAPDYYNRDTMVTYFAEALTEVQQRSPHFSMKLIYTGIRFFHPAIICNDMSHAWGVRERFPDLVVGYDLVGQEDAGFSTRYYLDCWLKRDSLAKAHGGIDLPLYFHDGETNLPNNTNLYDAVLLGTKRIGHGINLYRYPALEERVREQQICIEVSPLSNQILRYIPDLRNHPAVGYMNRGIPISLNTDDPSIFAYEGLTYDFWAATVAWGLDLASIKQLAMNGLIHSAMSEVEKQKAIDVWEADWEDWVRKKVRMSERSNV